MSEFQWRFLYNVVLKINDFKIDTKVFFSDESAMPDDVLNIVSSYIKPIQQLSAKFPNQQLELQIEFQGSYPKPRRPQRRFILHKEPQYRRTDMETDPFSTGPLHTPNKTNLSEPIIVKPTSTTTQTKETKPTDSDETTVFESKRKHSTTTETPSKEEKQKPVYIGDLKKMFDEFADKIKSTKCSADHPTTNQGPPQIIISNTGPVNDDRDINDIVELIQRGVQVNKDIPLPKNEDFDWMQIKIPV